MQSIETAGWADRERNQERNMDGFSAEVPAPIDEAVERTRAALGEYGFGVLADMDIAGTLNTKLGGERTPLRILGACNAPLADRALRSDPSLALLLPCNVVLEERQPGRTTVTAVDPRALLDTPDLRDLAEEAARGLEAAMFTLGAS